MDLIEGLALKLRIVSRTAQGKVLLTGICTAAALTFAAASSSSAHPGHEPYVSPYFTPTLEVASDNVSAGAHPNLTIKMVKERPNTCGPAYPWVNDGCNDPDPYIEQDLRDWHMTFPPGLMADIQAAPERCNDPQKNPEDGRYACPAGSKIGDIKTKWRRCFAPSDPSNGCADYTYGLPISGEIYMGVPEGNEQARLYSLIGPFDPPGRTLNIRIETVITARQGSGGVEIKAITSSIPDTLCINPSGPCVHQTEIAAQIYEAAMTIYGATGSERGHPLLTNPTSCSQRLFGSTFTGYAGYAQDNHPGEGYGKTVTDADPFPVRGCNGLDYSPSLSMGISPNTPGAIPALTTTLSQDQGEQTTKEVVVRFPRGIGINLANKVSPCPQDNYNADTCPDSARIGSVTAKSKLVPEGELSGNIYLGQASDGSLPLLISLKGFVDLNISGRVAVSANGQLEATFDNLPEVPISSFTLSLDGSTERGMLKVPTSCRQSTVETRFTSHQGKEHNTTTPINIGCNRGTLDVDVDPRKTGAHPTVTLEAKASGIRDVRFRIPKGLKVRKSSSLKWGTSYGSLSLQSTDSSDRYPLKPATESESAMSLGLAAVSSGRAQSITTLSPGIVKRSCKKVKRKKSAKSKRRSHIARTSAKKKKKRKKTCTRTASGGHAISFTGLPDDLTSVSVELEGEKGNFLSTPSKCKQKKQKKPKKSSSRARASKKKSTLIKPKLAFSARITDVKGTTYSPSKSVTLKCAKKKRSKKSSGKRSKKKR